jgi:SAM-dependent methyltransferase
MPTTTHSPTSNTTDTGAQLRSLYAPQGGTGHIFSSKVGDYAASRPDYPAALFEALRAQCHLQPGAVVADIGAGTGLLTQGLLAQGYTVTAVEPSETMRAAADHTLARHVGYTSAAGTAEQLPLPTATADLITAAQAFHWFDVPVARAEFLRVLKPQGHVALIWNDRVLTDPLHIALDVIFAQYGGAKRGAMLAHEERGQVPAFFGSAAPQELTWPHEHRLNEEGLLSLVFSRSYMPPRDSAPGQQACQQVRDLFHQLAIQDSIPVRYTTVAIVGRPQ